jgi:hypothetical protein
MKYILIEEGEDRTAIASNTVRSIHKTDFTKSNRYYLSLERDNGETDKFVVDDFEVREMSALELTAWLKGEDVSDEDEEKVAWQKYKQALETINNSESTWGIIPSTIKDWLEHRINACWATEECMKEYEREDDE